ncbi:MAG: PRC-barrel domain-containing protein [Nitrococcus mobilis]|nr:PRC-barrel domain-containing protein [Nitrococcus mobilis]
MKNVTNYLLLVALLIGPALLAQAAEQQAADSQPAEHAQQTHPAAPMQEGGKQAEETGGSSEPTEQMLEQSRSSETSRFIEQETSEQILASQLLGYAVTNLKNENVGHVQDLILDQNQRPVGMVISVGGFLGLGAKHIALPMSEVQINRANKIVQLNFSKEELNKAPSFTAQKPAQSEHKEEGSTGGPGGPDM